MHINYRAILTLCLLGLVIVASSAGMPQKDEEHPEFKAKNLKVLPKNISHEELDKVMDGFKAALGVKCNHCHASREDNPKKLDFASDAKPEKEIARNMMRMTARINKKYFRKDSGSEDHAMIQVQCKTCHRGMPEPDISK